MSCKGVIKGKSEIQKTVASSFVSRECCELAVGWCVCVCVGGVHLLHLNQGFFHTMVLAPGHAVAETMVADDQDRAEGAVVSEREGARGLQPGLGIVSEETRGVSMAQWRAMPNTCCDIALPWVTVID